MAVKLVIFDNDGVLVDSEPLGNRALVETMQGFGIPLTLAWAYANAVGRRPPDIGEMIRRDFNTNPPEDWERRYEEIALALFRQLQTVPGAAGLLEALQNKGVPYAVATSSTVKKTRVKYEVTGLDELIRPHHITTGEEVEKGKPAPDIFLLAARKNGVDPSECLVVEDSIAGVTGAVAAGMQVAGFLGGGHIAHLPGHAQALRTRGAHHIFTQLAEVGTLLGLKP